MNVHVTQFAEGLPRRGFTVADVRRMAEHGLFDPDERFELWGGEIVPMSPKSWRHERLKNWIDRELTLTLGRNLGVGSENQVDLSTNTFVIPDVVVYAEPEPDVDSLVHGDILLGIEVGLTSLRIDLTRKAQLYAACGLRELWVVDGSELVTHVFRDPSPTGYQTTFAATSERTVQASLVDVSLKLSDFE